MPVFHFPLNQTSLSADFCSAVINTAPPRSLQNKTLNRYHRHRSRAGTYPPIREGIPLAFPLSRHTYRRIRLLLQAIRSRA